jgi:hypothetical protein
MIILFLINNNLYLNEEGVCVYVYRIIHERDISEFLLPQPIIHIATIS